MIKKQPDLKFCDICEKSIIRKNGSLNGKITIKMDGLDFSGHAVGDASQKFNDVCDNCICYVVKTINNIKPNKDN